MPALGEELRAARESRHLSLSDVSDQIHIRSLYLQAIEEENWASIAAPVYVRGFVRTYARFLGLNPEEAVARYNGTAPAEAKAEAPKQPVYISDRRGPSLWLLGAGAIAVLLVVFVGYNYYQLQKSTQAAIIAEGTPIPTIAPINPITAPGGATANAPATHALPASPPAGPGLAVRLDDRSWLRVIVDGTNRMEGVFDAGTERVFRGKTATVRVGNAGGVDISVNGKDLGKMGASGDVVDRSFTLAQ
ncbi:MAG TPA: RodZ domain-containing protein [Candidatus Acidoferrales bacterium]|nr:RodZ domain-containing protein [Candidatus Acidoferrales bacterium]